MAEPDALYITAILRVRAQGLILTRATLAELDRALRLALRSLIASKPGDPITAARAEQLRRETLALLDEINRQLAQMVVGGSSQVTNLATLLHGRVLVRTLTERGMGLALQRQLLRRVNVRAAAVIAARRPNAALFETLFRRHLLHAAADLDRLLTAGVATGRSSRALARDIAELLLGRPGNLHPYGLPRTALPGLRSVRYDAHRIARTEINTAWREANAIQLDASPVVAGVAWQLSGNHPAPDECDILADTDFYGLGPGIYPTSRWPLAPHPHCECYQGRVVLRNPSEWTSPKPPAPELQVAPLDIGSPGEKPWTPVRLDRARRVIQASLQREVPGRRRAA